MILSNIFSSATSSFIQGSAERLPEIAKYLAPAVQWVLGKRRHEYELMLDCSTFLVILGVFLEIFEIVHELVEKFGPFKIHRPEMPKWMALAGFAGWLMIVAGVSGEFVFESKISTKNEELETISNALLGDAQLSAAEAIKQAGNAATNAQAAQDSADAENKASDDAQKKADAVGLQAVNLGGRLSASDAKLAGIDTKREKLENDLTNMAVCNSPRIITRWKLTGIGQTEADPLGTLPGQKVFIEYIPFDAEARRAALNLAAVLSDAKWDVQQPKPVDGLADGVSVQFSSTGLSHATLPHDPLLERAPIEAWRQAMDNAEKLVEFLHSYNWQAKREWPVDAQGGRLTDPSVLPEGAIRIQIGLYPSVIYVNPPGQQELTELEETFKRQWEESEAEDEKRLEQQLAGLTPEARKKRLDGEAEFNARQKAERAKYAQPCALLNTFTYPFQ